MLTAGALGSVAYVLMGVRSFVTSAWDFFKNPLGQVIGACILALAVWIWGDVHGTLKANARYEARVASVNKDWRGKFDKASADFEAAKTARSQRVEIDIAVFVRDRSREFERTAATNSKPETSNATPVRCPLTDADLRRLRAR